MKDFRPFVYGLVAFNILPHLSDLPLWIGLASFALLGWKIIVDRNFLPTPPKWLVMGLAVGLTLLIVNQFGSITGGEASAATLLIMASLKTFEMRGYRDIMVLTYLCYFLLMSKLIESQSLSMMIFMAVDVTLITALMMMYHSPHDEKRWTQLLKKSTSYFAWGLPLVLILFVMFPRFSASLWGKPKEAEARTGFSGQLQPGEISKLALSEETAFRVYFKDGLTPPFHELYWRGQVLNQSFGLSWSPGASQGPEIETDDELKYEGVSRYEIILEPHGQKWLFALDWPVELKSLRDSGRLRYEEKRGRIYESLRSLNNREHYEGVSVALSKNLKWVEPHTANMIHVETESPRAQQLALEFKAKATNSAQVVREILNYFARDFTYSLSSPSRGDLDDFLFEHRQGFCEHYAAATASLLRWAGIPSRVILGYQGGTSSFLADYLLVRQLDAHAWIEYWDFERATWIRVDPTSVVAPERIALGAQVYSERLAAQNEAGGEGDLGLGRLMGHEWKTRFFKLRMLGDQVESAWTGFLMRYDFNYQRELFAQLGLTNVHRWQLFFLAMAVIALLVIVFSWALGHVTSRQDLGGRLYAQLCSNLEKKGIKRWDNEAPLHFKNRVIQVLPEKKQELEQVFAEIIRFRYEDLSEDEVDPQALRKSIRAL